MSKTPALKISLLATACAAASYQCSLQAGSFSSDFNSGLPANTAVYGNAAISPNDGTGLGFTNSGCLQLTTATLSQNGAFLISNDLDAGVPVVSFTAKLKVFVGGGGRWDYADGLSFAFAQDVPLGTAGFPEAGVGSGISVGFRTFPTAGNPNPTISAYGTHVAAAGSPVYVDNVRANRFIDLLVQLNPDNTLSVVYDGAYVYSNVVVAYTPTAGSLFWLGARTGGSDENHFIDDVTVVTRTTPSPYISSFGPRGRDVPPNSGIDINLTDFATQVATGTIVLSLDGVTVSPSITQDGSGNTRVHCAPASPFAVSTQHTVSITFADNGATPQSQVFSWQFNVAEALPANFVTVFSDGFEGYARGDLDKNVTGDVNAAPNGSGNPWFGAYPANDQVIGSENGVDPHSGTNMIRGNYAGNQDVIWLNLAYRFHGGQPIKGNCMLDWWFYDPDTSSSPTAFKEYISLYHYNNAAVPAVTDWPPPWSMSGGLFWANGIDYTLEQSVSLGASGYNQAGGNFDPTKYQIRLEENRGATYGLDGWCNTAVSRSPGWHHNRIVLGPPHADGSVLVYFYIDDLATPVYSGLSSIAVTGFEVLELVSGWGDTDLAYYDDVSFALVRPPTVNATPGPGHHTTLTWPGEGFTLQSAAGLGGPWTDIPGATSGYNYDTASSSMQFFRLRN
jgi:hypothetical protein